MATELLAGHTCPCQERIFDGTRRDEINRVKTLRLRFLYDLGGIQLRQPNDLVRFRRRNGLIRLLSNAICPN